MTFWKVFWLYLLYSCGAALLVLGFGILGEYRFPGPIHLALLLFYTVFFILFIGWIPDHWLQVRTKGERPSYQEANVAILLGFGYERGSGGEILPGAGNRKLFQWTLENVPAKLLLVQEGIWVNIKEDPISLDQITVPPGDKVRWMVRAHIHNELNYINTLDSIYCALTTMEYFMKQTESIRTFQLKTGKVVLVAHELQLQRAIWDFQKVRKLKPEWQEIDLIIPEISGMPYPKDSVHWQTRNQFNYKLIELLISRPRDFFSSIPNQPKAKLDAAHIKLIGPDDENY